MLIRQSEARDDDALWRILEPTLPRRRNLPCPARHFARGTLSLYWHTPGHTVFVAEDAGTIVGTYYLRANNRGGGAHVANCGYAWSRRRHTVGASRRRCVRIHSTRPGHVDSSAMQFNFVIASNERAVRLWQRHGILPSPVGCRVLSSTRGSGLVDAYVMLRNL